MNIYSIALFSHMAGALGFFISLGLEWVSLRQIWRATSGVGLRNGLRLFRGVRAAGVIAMTALILSGLHMAFTVWSHVWWTFVALGTLVLLYIPVAVVTGMRIATINQAWVGKSGPLIASVYPLLQGPFLRISIQTRLGMALGILFIMIAKPDLTGALLAVGAATLLGLISALPYVRSERLRGQTAD